jgi:hypothetical protein
MLSGRASLVLSLLVPFLVERVKRIELATTTASHWDKTAKTKF